MMRCKGRAICVAIGFLGLVCWLRKSVLRVDDYAMLMDRGVSRPGGYAEKRYARGLASWRRTAGPLLAMLCGPMILARLVVLLIGGDRLSWLGGAVVGAFGMHWVMFRETPPRYVEQWHDGAEGERKTAKVLKRFEKAGWTVVHDVQQRYGNYDHIAVGPSGIYLLDSKNLEGTMRIEHGVPHLHRRHDPQARTANEQIPKRALASALAINKDIHARTGRSPWVQAVIVFWSDFPDACVEHDHCVYIHGTKLKGWLAKRPQRLDRIQVAQYAAAIECLAEERALSASSDPQTASKDGQCALKAQTHR